MELAGHLNRRGGLFGDLLGDGEDLSLRFVDSLLGTAAGNSCYLRVFIRLVYIDLSTSLVLDFVYVGATTTKDTCNRFGGYSKLDNVIRLLLKFDSLKDREKSPMRRKFL